ncbi:MAG: hypothetical protein IH934_05275 [Nanoarchaeota archaeon]|nr:hypothetical protein [Nanoarchaeota archaeon]
MTQPEWLEKARNLQPSSKEIELPTPKLIPKSKGLTSFTEAMPHLVKPGQEHVLEEPNPVVYVGLSQILASFQSYLSSLSVWHYLMQTDYPTVVIPEVAMELDAKLKQLAGTTSNVNPNQGISEWNPAQVELNVKRDLDLDMYLFDVWRETLSTYKTTHENYSNKGNAGILRTDVKVVNMALIRAGKYLKTFVISQHEEIHDLVDRLGETYPIHTFESDTTSTNYYGPVLDTLGALLTEDFTVGLSNVPVGQYGIFAEVEVVPGIKKPIGLKYSDQPIEQEGYISAPIIDLQMEGTPLPENADLIQKHGYIIGKLPNGQALLVGLTTFELNNRGSLVDQGGYYEDIKFSEYLRTTNINVLAEGQRTIQKHIRAHGLEASGLVIYTTLDTLIQRNLPEFWQRVTELAGAYN